ncbi:MAG: DUF2306 domain-containing protein [Balneolaceae bacterium]|nr:DUF2306 domain-containing protein [Balneolaceae bacterium]
MKKVFFGVFALLAVFISFYPISYLFIDSNTGFLSGKSGELLSSTLWWIGFYLHISFGGIALFVGWSQFISRVRQKYPKIHRIIGKIYVISVIISSIAGIGIGFFATGGVISATGFVLLGVVWFSFTVDAVRFIKAGDVINHQKAMIISYAVCFAAVTLRIYLGPLIMFFDDFVIAYRIVAWLCWVPNIAVALMIVRTHPSPEITLSRTI